MNKKPIYAKPRPKKLGKPKSFNVKSKAYKSAKRKADKKFGKKVSLYKNIFISKAIKKYKPRKKKWLVMFIIYHLAYPYKEEM